MSAQAANPAVNWDFLKGEDLHYSREPVHQASCLVMFDRDFLKSMFDGLVVSCSFVCEVIFKKVRLNAFRSVSCYLRYGRRLSRPTAAMIFSFGVIGRAVTAV